MYPRDFTVPCFIEALDHVSSYPNLRSISLSMRYLDYIDPHELGPDSGSALVDTAPFKVLYRLFDVASRKALKKLELEGVPAIRAPLTRDPRFEESMRTVQDLRLLFDELICNSMDWSGEPAIPQDFPHDTRAHEFTKHVEEWIGQNQAILKSLNLVFEGYLGYYPKLDLRNIHYPCLKVLKLSHVTLSHEAQIDWILSHKNTLTTLHLFDCPIIANISTKMVLDKEFYPVAGEVAQSITTAENDLRWHNVLTRFNTHLTFLKECNIEFHVAYPLYITYSFGAILASEVSERVCTENREADIEAYHRLMIRLGNPYISNFETVYHW
jgi:hypothetical protein